MEENLTYADIIEDKIEEWRTKLVELKRMTEEARPEQRAELNERRTRLLSAINTATLQLHELSARETTANTMVVKDSILKIFDSIDRDLTISETMPPYML